MATWVIGDIHGEAKLLNRILDTLSLGSKDMLITLGDYVNRGPDTPGVLDTLIHAGKVCDVVALRGNHDQLFIDRLAKPREKKPRQAFQMVGGDVTIKQYGALKKVPVKHRRFLKQTLHLLETQRHLFVHGHVDPDLPAKKQSPSVTLYRKLTEAEPHCSGKTVICGHTPQRNGKPIHLGHTIGVDTLKYAGWLTALNVSSLEFVQAHRSKGTRGQRLVYPK